MHDSKVLAAAIGALLATGALAQADAGVSAEDMADLERALAADAASTDGGTRAPTDATASGGGEAPAQGGGFGALQSLNPDISVIGDIGVQWFSSDAPLATGAEEAPASGFEFGGVELVLAKAVDPYFRLDAVIVLQAEGVEVEEAYATTLSLPAQLQLRAGQFLTRFGRLNTQHPHAWEFVDRPFALSRVFGAEGNRAPGVELSWLTPLPWYVELVGALNTAAGPTWFGEEEPPALRSPLDLQAMAAMKHFFPLGDDLSLSAGLSAMTGPTLDARAGIYGVDAYLKYRPLAGASETVIALQTEWLWRTRGVEETTFHDFGGYAQVLWKWSKQWGTALRWEYGAAAWTNPVVVDPLREDPTDPDWTRARQRASASLTFWPTEFSRIRVQGNADLPQWRTGVDWSAFLMFEFSAGVHGAHAF